MPQLLENFAVLHDVREQYELVLCQNTTLVPMWLMECLKRLWPFGMKNPNRNFKKRK